MSWAFAAMAGMNILSGLSSAKAAKKEAKAKAQWQAYSNTMVRLSEGQNQNTITSNELMAEDAFAQQAMGIKKQSIMTQGAAEVAAAAAGVKGRSVNQAMNEITRNAATMERQRQIERDNTLLGFDQQRANSRLSAEMQQDYSYIPKPSTASFLMSSAMSTYQQGASMYGKGSNQGGMWDFFYK